MSSSGLGRTKPQAYNVLLTAIVILIASTVALNIYWSSSDCNSRSATATGGPGPLESLPAFVAERKPQRGEVGGRPIANSTNRDAKAKILVVYAGPSNKAARLVRLYRKNLEFFLEHGVECETQDTVIVVGHDFYDEYLPRVDELNAQRCRHNGKVILVARRDVCYDMEAARLVAYGGVHGINVRSYDHFVFANCGLTGPAPRETLSGDGPWTSKFIDLLDDRVKMSGLVVNCEQPHVAHVMSMVYALDRTGLDVILESGAFYDCLDPPTTDFINLYERKMGTAILEAGYSLRPIVGDGFTLSNGNREDCKPCALMNQSVTGLSCQERAKYSDIWIESRLKAIYGGRTPSLNETVFFKTSRVFPSEIAQLVGWDTTIPINWQWQ